MVQIKGRPQVELAGSLVTVNKKPDHSTNRWVAIRLFGSTLLGLFVAETAIMHLMPHLPEPLSHWHEFVDAMLLTFVAGPILYFVSLRPLLRSQAEIRRLKGIIPVCAWCRKVLNNQGDWQQLEAYVREHSDADFTHGICPACTARVEQEADASNERK